MVIMISDFSTSINILRDTDKKLNYLLTPNSKNVANQIVSDFKLGIRSFNIVGTYGTGKSSFLVALEKSLKNINKYFKLEFKQKQTVDFLKIVGSYKSLISVFEDHYQIQPKENRIEFVLSEIFNQYYSFKSENHILFIVIDEFGKFLEYASENNPELELYFFQQLAEFCNNTKHNIVLLTTIHQSFESYSISLKNHQKQEWIKVKGRFREITFNEPIEQLLYLASEHISNLNFEIDHNIKHSELVNLIKFSKALNLEEKYYENNSQMLFPLDLISATILAQSLQRYGQNERSLFSFLESTDYTGLSNFNRSNNPFFNISCVYDYLNYNFYSFLTSKYNPDFAYWSSIRSSIEETERVFDESINNYIKIIKTIGLLNIFIPPGATLDKKFLSTYLKISNGILNASMLIDKLEHHKIIIYRNYSQRYVLFEGTDLDIQSALLEAGNKLTETKDIASLIKKHFQFSPVFVKQYSFLNGTPRFFEYIISDEPINQTPFNEIDGFINLIFNENIDISKLEKHSKNQSEAILYAYYSNSNEIKNVLFEIERTQRVILENSEDKIAVKELNNIIDHYKNLLNYYILDTNFSSKSEVIWIWKGFRKDIKSKKDLNKLLSQICYEVYDKTPIYKNELINKHNISSQIHTAKRNYFKALVNNEDKHDLGFDIDKFPPEKTIFLTLLKKNGISSTQNFDEISSNISTELKFNILWDECNKFVQDSKIERKRIDALYDTLSARPFKLKKGLIDLWIPTFLFLRKDDFALFSNGAFVPYLSEEVLELIQKNPDEFEIKAFDIDGVKLNIVNSFRTYLNLSTDEKVDKTAFIELIKPFLIFYKQLPVYTKNTKRLSREAKSIREVISNSQDPEKTFFEEFPSALGFNLTQLSDNENSLKKFVSSIQDSVKELRTSYDNLIDRIETFIKTDILYEELDFENYKLKLQQRYKKIKKHMLLTSQKSFIQRLDSAIDDKKAWLNSLAQAIMTKPIDNFTDEDEVAFYDKFKSTIIELDSLTNISKYEVESESEEIVSVKIDSFFSKIDPKIVRIPKKKSNEIQKIKNLLKDNLSNDKTLNIAAIVDLLKDCFNNE